MDKESNGSVSPTAVLISDVHFSLQTLGLAASALEQALDRAHELKVPLIVAGDLTDGKALIRGEVCNRLISIFGRNREAESPVQVYVIVGNHDKLNEHGLDHEHALHFLSPYVDAVVDSVMTLPNSSITMLPYFNSIESLEAVLTWLPIGSTLVLHQGIKTADMGSYIQDKSALPAEAFAAFRCISGHYHCAQDIICDGREHASLGEPGVYSFIGSPYTITFTEANDPPKGFRVLYSDGTLRTVTTNLRRHVVMDVTSELLESVLSESDDVTPQDKLWLKVRGPYSELQKLDKAAIGNRLLTHSNYKLDLIPDDSAELSLISTGAAVGPAQRVSGEELMDGLIDTLPESTDRKAFLKEFWRGIVS